MPTLDLFSKALDFDLEKRSGPLADRVRPIKLEQFVGQEHLLGPGKILQKLIEKDKLQSMVFWGPPGSGKTTLAAVIANATGHNFAPLSAVFSSIKEVRTIMESAHTQRHIYDRKTIVFIDEIHRFNKAQQDAFLPFVEKGDIILIGATTENPSFEIIAALLSRTRVLVLHPLSGNHIAAIIRQALADEKNGLGTTAVQIEEEVIEMMADLANGDARSALNALELAYNLALIEDESCRIGPEIVREAYQKKTLRYDKSGEEHYNLISALHKSLRGSDPDAALYWLARMIEAGEDPLYIARRMIRFASEDIGNADPGALTLTLAARDSYHFLGPPEGELALAQAAVYLATAPKSNAIYKAYNEVKSIIRETGNLEVPLHIRNAPTKLMKSLNYGQDYQYDHDSEDHYIPQHYLPDRIRDKKFYRPSKFGFEKEIQKRLDWWAKKKNEAESSQK